MKRNMLLLAAICSCCNLFAEEVIVKQFRHAGPYEVKKPFLNDSLDVNSKKFTEKELLKTAIPFSNVRKAHKYWKPTPTEKDYSPPLPCPIRSDWPLST